MEHIHGFPARDLAVVERPLGEFPGGGVACESCECKKSVLGKVAHLKRETPPSTLCVSRMIRGPVKGQHQTQRATPPCGGRQAKSGKGMERLKNYKPFFLVEFQGE